MVAEQSPLSGSEPVLQPSIWNDNPAIKGSHNCYAYAVGQISPDAVEVCREKQTTGVTRRDKKCRTPQPGHASGHPQMSRTPIKRCADIRSRTLDDITAAFPTTFNAKCPVGTSKIALAVDRAHDYHYYRQDSNGLWSHKPGRDPVTNVDARGKLIINPETASRDNRPNGSNLNYSSFCGFMCVPRGAPLILTAGRRRRVSTHRKTTRHATKHRVGTRRKTTRHATKHSKTTRRKTTRR